MKIIDALSFCELWLPLWTGNQPEQLIEVYDEDIFYRDPAKPDGVYGKSNLLRYFRKLLAVYPDWVWKVKDVYPIEGGFTLTWTAAIPAGGTIILEQGMDLVLIEGGKIVRNEVYFDKSALLAAHTGRDG